MARFSELPVGEPGLGVGAVRRSECARLQGKQEFANLETKQNQKKGFRYVIARIDESEIAGFAAAKLWIDFSQQREGPAGTGLLSLLYGLSAQPLPPAAVKLAAEVDRR
jgi:hypothetical protein